MIFDENGDDEDDEFLECDNNNSFVTHNGVVREESVPKTNHLEEKLLFRSDGNSSSTSSVESSTFMMGSPTRQQSYGDVIATVTFTTDAATMATTATVDNWCQQDSGVMMAATQSVGTTMSRDNHIGVRI